MTTHRRPQPNRIAFGEFLAHLRTKGFVIGVDQHLRLQRLLARVEGQCSPEQIKTLICPLFATSREQQHEFYQAFDEYFAVFKPEPAQDTITHAPPDVTPPDDRKKTPPPRSRALLYTLLAVSIITLAALSATERFRLLIGLKQLPLPAPEMKIPRPPADTITIKETIRPTEVPPTPTPTPLRDPVLDHRRRWRILAIALPLVFYALWHLWRWWRRRPVIEKAQGRRPPFTWPIELEPEQWRLDRSPLFYQAARGLRRRQLDDYERLDIPKTIDATIEARGYPSFRYRQASRVPEYLVLIDRASPHDHQARYYDQIARALERDDVFVVRYFYEGDPRVCRAAESGQGFYLAELQRRYPVHRLILMGDGGQLLDPVTGDLQPWSDLLTEWADCAILTPVSLPAWRRRERILGRSFTLLPGTMAGMVELADRYELPLLDEPPSGDDASNADAPPDVEYGVTIEELRRYLGPDAFQWLCACAFYPELQWDLTLKLGQVVLPGEAAARLDEATLWRLLRLPWFREGAIPDGIRLELVKSLDPESATRVRELLIETLERNPAEDGTYAADERRLDIAVQKSWLAGDDRRKRKEALKEIEHLPPGELHRDYTLVRLLEDRPTSLLALILPQRFRKLFYPAGLSLYGIRWQAALVMAALTALVAWGGVEGLIRYREGIKARPTPTPTPTATPPPASSPIPTPPAQTTPSPGASPSPSVTLSPTLVPTPTGQQSDVVTLPNEIKLEMVYVPGGAFIMGSPPNEVDRSEDEGPQHRVTVQGFYMGKYEVTQAQWKAVMGSDPSRFKGDDLPVENVSWNDAQEFCARLTKLTGRQYRLPSEAEWEYACRAGTTTPFAFGSSLASEQANFDGNYPYGGAPKGIYRQKTTPVGSFKPNAFGLYDMHGNVWEWVQDIWHDNYNGAPTDGSAWLSGGDSSFRGLRGGSWDDYGDACRSANRSNDLPDARYYTLGFRVVVGARAP